MKAYLTKSFGKTSKFVKHFPKWFLPIQFLFACGLNYGPGEDKYKRGEQAGAELCQAQYKLEFAKFWFGSEASLKFDCLKWG